MKKLNGYWIARLVVKWLIPVMFFLIAASENIYMAQALGGISVILTLAYYLLIWQEVGLNKYINK